jgi:hypothetical protein
MMRISVFLVCLVMLALAGSVALAAPPTGKGVPGATDPAEAPSTGAPTDTDPNRNAWGAVTSQFASNTADDTTLGQHASDPTPDPGDESVGGRGTHDTPRLGVGNVARNDSDLAASLGVEDAGGRPSDHACIVGPLFGSDCFGDPGPLP